MKKLFILAAIPLLLNSCVMTSVTRLDHSAKVLSPTTPDKVQIYLSESDAPKPFNKIALISAKSDGAVQSEQIFAKIRKDAAKLGANGVIVNHSTRPSSGAQIAGAFLGYSAQTQGEYTAIKTRR